MSQDELDIKRVRAAELEILDVVDAFCRNHQIKYSLAYGTLLGAVRHGGFIPWDDDIDIMMLREDYDRFLDLWQNNPSQGYILQNKQTDPELPNTFTKIRKDHTTFLQFESERHCSYHLGIFIDLFPLDRVAPTRLSQYGQQIDLMFYLLFNRGYSSAHGGLVHVIEKALLKMVKSRKYADISEKWGKRAQRWKDHDTAQLLSACTKRECRLFFPSDLFDEVTDITFAGKSYLAVKKTDAYLKTMYGDYMTLPPEEERVWTHHPFIVDFEHNYEELPQEAR